MRDPGSATGVYARLLSRLDERGVTYALMRDEPAAAGDELDLLVWPRDRERFARAAREAGFARARSRVPLKDVFAAYDAEEGLRLLDVHYALVQGGVVYLPLPDPGERRREGHPRLRPEDELLHLYFHSLLGKQGVQPKHEDRVRALIEVADRGRIRARVPDPFLRAGVEAFLAEPERFAQGSPDARGAAARARRRLLRAPGNRWRDFSFRRLAGLLHRRRGTLVVFMGVDGAGKTTTVEKVSARLEAAKRFPFAHVYMGPWGQFRTRLLGWAYARGFAPPEEDWLGRLRDRLRGHGDAGLWHCLSKWVRGLVRGAGYYGAVYFDLWQRYRKDIRPRLRRGDLVLADRWIHDLRYLHHSKPITVFPRTRRLLCALFPRPHLVFFLFHDPEVIAARKAQLDADEIRRYQESYRQALAGLPLVEVRTDRSADEVAADVTRRILAVAIERR